MMRTYMQASLHLVANLKNKYSLNKNVVKKSKIAFT